jgi:hypothetical protein
MLLDNGDGDFGGCGAVLIDVPGARPSQLALALGKDGNAFSLHTGECKGLCKITGLGFARIEHGNRHTMKRDG